MKKIQSSLFALTLLLSVSSNSAEFQGGIKLGHGELTATDKSGDINNATAGDQSKSSAYGALFIEGKIDSGLPFNLVAGLEYIPLKAVIDIATDNGGDYEGTLKNHTTIYLQGSKDVGNDLEVFGKIGYVRVDIEDVTSSTHTLTAVDGNASGHTYGLGVQKNLSGPIDFIRIGADYIDYGSVSATASTGTYKADADAIAGYISFGKKF
jgi:hypothetical protein